MDDQSCICGAKMVIQMVFDHGSQVPKLIEGQFDESYNVLGKGGAD